MARRYGSAFTQGWSPTVFALQSSLMVGTRQIVAGATGSVSCFPPSTRLMIAPAAYSEVRKVIFWATFRHEHTGTALSGVNARLRVLPSSTSATAKVIQSKVLASGTNIREDASPMWDANPQPTSEGAMYDWHSERANLEAILKFGVLDTAGSQTVYQEFDRFEFADADFFTDWDSVAASADKDKFVMYRMGIQRTDAVAWTSGPSTANTNTPILVSCGFSVVQAPAEVNYTRLQLPAGPGEDQTAAINLTLGGERGTLFIYRAADWSGTMQIRAVIRQSGVSANHGRYVISVGKVTVGSSVVTPIYTETFDVGAGQTDINFIARTANFKSFLTEGDMIVAQLKTPVSIGNVSFPYTWWEITHTGFTKTPLYFPLGHQAQSQSQIPGTPPGALPTWSKTDSLFDPLWFEDMEAERFLESKVQGALIHSNASNNSSTDINLNANLGADVSTSLFNVIISPNVSSTPNATTGFKVVDAAITSNDPKNLAGIRKMTMRYTGSTWTAGSGDFPGTMALVYIVDVPNTDVLPLGPLFDLGSFDAEGCAATSAGLGEPGVLVITNGSSVPKKFNPTAAGTTGEIEDAGIPTPFEGEVPGAVATDTASSPVGGLDVGTYRYRYTFRNCCTGKESDPNPEDIVVSTLGTSPAAKVTFSFAGVRIPGDPQICEICLYRTVESGTFPIMAKVGCFNIDSTTIFVDQVSDNALDFTLHGLSLLNAPMPCVPIVVDFRNRLFGMGDIPNLAMAGTVSVVVGSDIVTGSFDVAWDRCLEGKFIQVGADCRSYEILRVLPPAVGTSPPIERLKLTEVYAGTTDTGLTYHICGRPNRVYFSEPIEPEYWPAANFLDVEPGDGDRIMGAVSNFDRLIICKRRKTYVLTFSINPGTEVFVPSRISSDIGCIGPRTFAQVESGSVWLADRGLAIYDGRTVQHVEESVQMHDIFVDPSNPNYVRRDRNGRVIDAVGVFYPKREQYLLLLPTVNTTRGCDMMLVWDTKLRNITLLKFCQQFQSMVIAKDAEGNERVYLGDVNGFVWVYDVGDTDGAGFPNATGTVRGDVTFAGTDSLTLASILESTGASFIVGGVPGVAALSGLPGFSGFLAGTVMGLAGACVYTRLKGSAYDVPWTSRTIYMATEDRLYVTPEWGAEVPFDATGEFEYEFMIGPIEMDLTFKPQNYGVDDVQKRSWQQIVVHETEQFSSKLRVDLLPDFQLSDPEADTVIGDDGETGQGRTFSMDYSRGRQLRKVGRNIHNFMAIRMRNFAPEEPIRIINHILCEEPRSSK